ncbi:MAG: hypothetical protein A2X52_14410 [Candidatus Rokubacteria bacterium GWC2_70_16]|nr:MAG: hypothetical protein A2X52_14410 [Candidatus Rokubacteria bacterium GWC2_70_16]
MEQAARRAKLQELYELAQGSEEFEGGVTVDEGTEALIVGDWAIFAVDDLGDLALSFHLDSHPLAVARLTRFLVQHEVPFVLHESFTIDDDDRIVFESDAGSDLCDSK